MGQTIDLRGERFGRLTVVERAGSSAQGHVRWTCRCDCGTQTVANSNNLRRKNGTVSCGCLGRELARERAIARNLKHGAARDGAKWPEYMVWRGMKQRCLNPNDANFKHYGGRDGRGIKVCERWPGDDGFASFLVDMGRRPSRYHSIDRRDNDGDYEPRNCRWTTSSVQMSNQQRQDYALNPLSGI